MDADDIVIAASAISIISVVGMRKQRRKRKRRSWVKEWVGERKDYGAFHMLLGQLKQADLSSYRNVLRMHSTSCEELLIKDAPISKQTDTVMRDAIPPDERLSVTLRFLATGKY